MEADPTGKLTAFCEYCRQPVYALPAEVPIWLHSGSHKRHCSTLLATPSKSATGYNRFWQPDPADDVEHHYGRSRSERNWIDPRFTNVWAPPAMPTVKTCHGFWHDQNRRAEEGVWCVCGRRRENHPVVIG